MKLKYYIEHLLKLDGEMEVFKHSSNPEHYNALLPLTIVKTPTKVKPRRATFRDMMDGESYSMTVFDRVPHEEDGQEVFVVG